MATETPYEPSSVLVVEDTLDDAALALRALRGCDRPLAVSVVRDALRARETLGLDVETGVSGRKAPDLVISDLKLPGLDGHELLCLVRADRRLARVPYLLFSSSNELSDVQRCLDCGADAYVQKPIGFEAYLDCLRSVVHWAFDGFPPSRTPSCVIAQGGIHAAAREGA